MAQMLSRAENTKNSDWFKSAVLFWKNQGDSEDIFSERCKSPGSPRKHASVIASPSKVECGKTLGKKEDSVKSNNSSFDEAELLMQVKELEDFLSNQCSSEHERSECSSPHLTLEFPEGSSIKSNPLFNNASENFIKQNNIVQTNPILGTFLLEKDKKENQRNEICPQQICLKKKDTTIEKLPRTIEKETAKSCDCDLFENYGSLKRSSSCNKNVEISLTNVKGERNSILNESNNLNNILKVQETLEEISREIISSKKKIKQHRDPNEIMSKLLSTIKPPNGGKIDNKCVSQNLPSFNNKLQSSIEKPVTEESVLDKSAILLQQIDELVKFETDALKDSDKFQLHSKARERLDSGLQSTSNSTGNSPYPSPSFARSDKTPQEFVSKKSLHRNTDRSDSSSDWSPSSTLETLRNNLEKKTMSFTASDFTADFSHESLPGPNLGSKLKVNGNTELCAVKKFIRLTEDLKERKSEISFEKYGPESYASIPSLQTAIELHRRELQQQREKQEEFLHQLGDLLLEIVNLKDEQMAVRIKQTKALSLMKKQLDIHKKNQTQAHSDVLNQVQSIHERLNSNINKSFDNDSNQVRAYALPPLSNYMQIFGETIWKVTDVMKKLHRAKSGLVDGTLVSAPFHTSQYGYKMNGWLYLNGRGKSAGSYLSVYVCVLVGEYDAILPWPFKPCYKFTLIDQRADILKRKDHIKIRRVIDIAGRGANVITQYGGIPRPSNSTKALIVGYDDFIPHEQLSPKFLVDDTLFLKIEVEADGEIK